MFVHWVIMSVKTTKYYISYIIQVYLACNNKILLLYVNKSACADPDVKCPRNVSLLMPYLNIWEGHTLLGMKVNGPVELGTQVCLYNGRHLGVELHSWGLPFRLHQNVSPQECKLQLN